MKHYSTPRCAVTIRYINNQTQTPIPSRVKTARILDKPSRSDDVTYTFIMRLFLAEREIRFDGHNRNTRGDRSVVASVLSETKCTVADTMKWNTGE